VTTEGHAIDAIAQIVDLPVGSRGT
jgi:hypothetical protein